MKKLELVEEWRCAWKWISVKCMTLSFALQGAWMFIPQDLKVGLPPNLITGVAMALLAVGVAGRVVKQDTPDCEPKHEDHPQ